MSFNLRTNTFFAQQKGVSERLKTYAIGLKYFRKKVILYPPMRHHSPLRGRGE